MPHLPPSCPHGRRRRCPPVPGLPVVAAAAAGGDGVGLGGRGAEAAAAAAVAAAAAATLVVDGAELGVQGAPDLVQVKVEAFEVLYSEFYRYFRLWLVFL